MKNPNHYQILIKDGKYFKEYECALFLELHLWRFKWWMHVKSQRGPLFHICHTANKWSNMLNCDVIDKTIEL